RDDFAARLRAVRDRPGRCGVLGLATVDSPGPAGRSGCHDHPGARHRLLRRPLDLATAVRTPAGLVRTADPRAVDALGDAAARDPRRRCGGRVRPPGRTPDGAADPTVAGPLAAPGHVRTVGSGPGGDVERDAAPGHARPAGGPADGDRSDAGAAHRRAERPDRHALVDVAV